MELPEKAVMQLPEKILGELLSVELPETRFPLSPPPGKKDPACAVIALPGKFSRRIYFDQITRFSLAKYV